MTVEQDRSDDLEDAIVEMDQRLKAMEVLVTQILNNQQQINAMTKRKPTKKGQRDRFIALLIVVAGFVVAVPWEAGSFRSEGLNLSDGAAIIAALAGAGFLGKAQLDDAIDDATMS